MDQNWTMLILLLLCVISAAISLTVAAQFVAALRRISRPDPAPWTHVGGVATAIRLSVVIPARDEEVDIEQALRSVLDQVGVEMEVFVVNDHSSDRTGSIVDAIAATDDRVCVLHDPELPQGWLGKCNAMQQAAAQASGEFLLFTDADVRHEPGSFASALAEMQGRPLDFLSLFPQIHCISLWENVLVPAYVGGLAQLASARIETAGSQEALAAGAFMMVRSAAFRAVGGFESIRGEMFDDVGLARLVKRRGYRVGFRACPQRLQVRLFKGNRHAFWGMTKNVLEILGGRLWLAPLVMALPCFVFWTPLVALAVGLSQRDAPLVMVAAATYAIQYGLLWLGRSLFRFHPGKTLLFPLVAFTTTCCMVRALYFYVSKDSVRWRGRTIRVRGVTSET